QLTPIDLVRTNGLPLSVSFPESSFTLPPDAAWLQMSQTGDELVYAWDDGNVHLEKRYTFVPNSYEVKLKIIVENRGDKPLTEHLQVSVHGKQDPNIKSGGFFAPRVTQTEGVCNLNGKLKHENLENLLKTRVDEMGLVRWVGVDEKFFLVAAALNPGTETHKC